MRAQKIFHFNVGTLLIFNHRKKIKGTLDTEEKTEEAISYVRNKNIPGFWVLETSIDYLNDKIKKLLDKYLVRAKSSKFFETEASLYVLSENYKMSYKPLIIPLSSCTIDSYLKLSSDENSTVNGHLQIVSPEYRFPPGCYCLILKLNTNVAEKFGFILKASIGRLEMTKTIVEENNEIRFFIEMPGEIKGRIVIECMEKIKIEILTRMLQLKAIVIQKVDYLGAFLANQINKCQNCIVILSVRDEAQYKLSGKTKYDFNKIGLRKASRIPYGTSYIAIIENGKVVYEKAAKKRLRHKKDDIDIVSGGFLYGNVSKIIFRGKDYSPNMRGFNVVVLRDFEVLGFYADTHKDPDNMVFSQLPESIY